MQLFAETRPRTLLSARWTWLTLTTVVFVGAILRIYQLGQESIWTDEGFTIWLSRQSVTQIIYVTSTWEYNPALYHLIIHYWMNIFGSSEVSVRMPSVIFGLVTIYAIYLLGTLLFNRATGLISALLVALSTEMVRYGQEARTHSLMSMLSTLSLYFYVRLLQERRRAILLGYLLVTAILLYAHPYSTFIVVAQSVHFISWRLISRRPYAISFPYWVLVQIALLVIALPQISIYANRVLTTHESHWWLPAPRMRDLLYTFQIYSGSLLLTLLFGLFALLALFTWQITSGKWDWRDLPGTFEHYRLSLSLANLRQVYLLLVCIAMIIGIPFALSRLGTPIYQVKYTLTAAIAFYILVARGITTLRSIPARGVALVVIGALMLLNVGQYYQSVEKPPWREIVADIEQQTQPGDLLVFHAGFLQELCYDYYSRQPRLARLPFVDRDIDTVSTPVTDLALANLQHNVEPYKRVWLIVSHIDPKNGDAMQSALSGRYTTVGEWSYPGARVMLEQAIDETTGQ